MTYEVCKHGGLRRKCDTCDLAEEVKELRHDLRTLRAALGRIADGGDYSYAVIAQEALASVEEGDNGG